MATVRRALQIAAITTVIFLLGVGATLNISPINNRVFHGKERDNRINGLRFSGWLNSEFSFSLPYIAAKSAKIIFELQAINQPGLFPELKVISGGRLESATNGRYIVLPDDTTEITFAAVQPIVKEDGSQLAGRLKTFAVEPRNVLLLPALYPAGILVLLAAIVSFLLALLMHPVAGFLPAVLPVYFYYGSLGGASRVLVLLTVLTCLLSGLAAAKYWLRSERHNLAATATRGWNGVLLILILVAGFYYRFVAIDFGLPQLYHPDEGNKLKIITRFVETGDLNPNYFRHPTFLLYSGAAVQWVREVFTGVDRAIETVAVSARLVSVLLGTATIFLTYLIGRALYTPVVGLVSAAFMALLPLAVVSSRYVKEDAALLFFVLLTLYLVITAVQQKSYKTLLVGSFVAGVASSAKYSGLLCWGFPLIGFLFFVPKVEPKSLFKLLPLAILPIVGFLAISPYALLNSEVFIRDFSSESSHMEQGHNVAIYPSDYFWLYHIGRSLMPGMTDIVALASLVAFGVCLYRRRYSDMLIIAVALFFYLPAEWVRAKPEPQPERYILPVLPFLSIMLAAMLQTAPKHLAHGLFIILFGSAAIYTHSHTKAAMLDTRQQATDWIQANLPVGSKILTEWRYYGIGQIKDYEVIEVRRNPVVSKAFSAEYLKNNNFDYFVSSSLAYDRFFRPEYSRNYQRFVYDQIFANFPEVYGFRGEPYNFGFHNPTIKVLKIKP